MAKVGARSRGTKPVDLEESPWRQYSGAYICEYFVGLHHHSTAKYMYSIEYTNISRFYRKNRPIVRIFGVFPTCKIVHSPPGSLSANIDFQPRFLVSIDSNRIFYEYLAQKHVTESNIWKSLFIEYSQIFNEHRISPEALIRQPCKQAPTVHIKRSPRGTAKLMATFSHRADFSPSNAATRHRAGRG